MLVLKLILHSWHLDWKSRTVSFQC